MKQLQTQTLEELKPLLARWKEPKNIEMGGDSVKLRWNASWQNECYITIWQSSIDFIFLGTCQCCETEEQLVEDSVDIATWDRTIPAQWAEYMDDNFRKGEADNGNS